MSLLDRLAEIERRHRPDVPQSAWEAPLRQDAVKADQGTRHRRRAAWLPVELPRVGGGADKHTSLSGRGRACPYGAQPDGGGLCAQRPFRAPAPPDGRLGGLPQGRAREGGPATPVTVAALRHTLPVALHDRIIPPAESYIGIAVAFGGRVGNTCSGSAETLSGPLHRPSIAFGELSAPRSGRQLQWPPITVFNTGC